MISENRFLFSSVANTSRVETTPNPKSISTPSHLADRNDKKLLDARAWSDG